MSVITISRGSFSGGTMLAACLAQKLGYRCVDRDLVVQTAATYGVSQDDIRAALEKPPSFLGHSKHTRYVYLALVQATLAQEVWEGNAIYHGLAGHLLLKGVPHVLRTRIIAPMPFRISAVQERLKLGRDAAIAHIQKMDEDRRKWTQFLYGVDWTDAALYDVVINLGSMELEEAADVIGAMTKQKSFQTTPESQQAMDNLVLASRLRANLAMDPATSELEMEVTADRGTVWVGGGLLDPKQAKEIQRIARALPGVKAVQLEKLAMAVRF